MKKIGLFLGALSIALLTAASQTHERVGQRIGLLGAPPATFPANEPFHIAHGWVPIVPKDGPPIAVGLYDFDLEVDGVFRPHDFVDRFDFDESNPEPEFVWLWVHNFPEGMTGTHTFTGHWFSPCQEAVDRGDYPGPCAHPNDVVEVLTATAEVTFVDP